MRMHQATSDPALQESADRGEVNLLSYAELYRLWERQQWRTQDIDFTQDRIDWHERIPAEERFQRMYGLSSFFIGEQRVAEELGPEDRERSLDLGSDLLVLGAAVPQLRWTFPERLARFRRQAAPMVDVEHARFGNARSRGADQSPSL